MIEKSVHSRKGQMKIRYVLCEQYIQQSSNDFIDDACYFSFVLSVKIWKKRGETYLQDQGESYLDILYHFDSPQVKNIFLVFIVHSTND